MDFKRKDQKDRKRNNQPKPVKYSPDKEVWGIVNKVVMAWAKEHQEEELDLDAPYFSPQKLIKHRTALYKNSTIAEAFSDAYGLNIVPCETGENVPTELRVGDVISLTIGHIGKNEVTFNTGNLKQNVITRNNLYKYEKFKHVLPLDPIQAQVIEVSPSRIVVDMFKPMVEEFLNPICANHQIQNKVNPDEVSPVTVKNLVLVRGGFKGKVVIPNVSSWVGEDFEMDAFIPGSQICLNIADDFDAYEGTTVQAFVSALSIAPGGQKSVICSAKAYLRHLGYLKLKEIFDMWCDDGEEIKEFSSTVLEAKVTGTINTVRQTGVFVEIPEFNITGFVKTNEESLVKYEPGSPVFVKFKTFDEPVVYNDATGQYEHNKDTFVIEKDYFAEVNVKPIFEFV